MKRFSVHTSLQILKLVGPLSKMKPCTRRGSEVCTTISFQPLFASYRQIQNLFCFLNSVLVILSLYFYEVLSHEKSANRRRGEHLREGAHRGGICVLHCTPEKRLSRAPTALPILLPLQDSAAQSSTAAVGGGQDTGIGQHMAKHTSEQIITVIRKCKTIHRAEFLFDYSIERNICIEKSQNK